MAEVKKFSPMRWTAATEEAAVAGALQIVGASRDDIEYEVLDRGAKGVTVRVKPRSAETPVPAAAPESAAAVDEAGLPLQAEDVPAGDEEDDYDEEATPVGAEEFEEVAYDEEDYDDQPPIYADGASSEAESLFDVESEEADEAEAEPEPELAPLDMEAAEQACALAQDFLDRMGLEAEAAIGDGGTARAVSLVVAGEDVGILIGKHGQTLQAFQYLLNLTLNNEVHASGADNGMRVTVDAGDYRRRRQNSLEQAARAAAARARRERRPIRMEPMPAHERRMVHMVLQGEADLTTASEGRDPQRRIVITPAGATSRPAGGGGSRGGGRLYGDRDRGGDRNSGGGYGDRGGNSGNSGGGGYGDRGASGGGGYGDGRSNRRGMGGYGGPRRGYGGR